MANRKLNEILLSGEVDGIKTSGVTPLEMGDHVWNDILGYALARNLDGSRGHIDYDFDEGTLDFDDSATVTNSNDSLIVNYQLPHDCYRGVGAELRPHIHWFQENSGTPYQKVEYRVLANGGSSVGFEPWTAMDPANFEMKFTYVSGVLKQIVQLEPIDISACGLSCIIQVRMWRDGQNALDTYGSTKVKMLFFDAHYPKYKEGSQDEYVQ